MFLFGSRVAIKDYLSLYWKDIGGPLLRGLDELRQRDHLLKEMSTKLEVPGEKCGADIFSPKITELADSAHPPVKARVRSVVSPLLRQAGRRTYEYHHCASGSLRPN